MAKYKYKLSREMYRDIKYKMTADDIAELLSNVFEAGVNSAIKNTQSVSVDSLHNAISKISGIGETRLKKIDEAIEQVLGGNNNNG